MAGLQITAQGFEGDNTPEGWRHGPAVALGLIPSMSAWSWQTVASTYDATRTLLCEAMEPAARAATAVETSERRRLGHHERLGVRARELADALREGPRVRVERVRVVARARAGGGAASFSGPALEARRSKYRGPRTHARAAFAMRSPRVSLMRYPRPMIQLEQKMSRSTTSIATLGTP